HACLHFPRVPRSPRATLFPYTTLFRSAGRIGGVVAGRLLGDNGIQIDDAALPFRQCRLQAGAEVHHAGEIDIDHAGEMLALEFRSEEHTSELQSRENLVCRLLLEKKKR